jgi:pilus assembly protein CpaB
MDRRFLTVFIVSLLFALVVALGFYKVTSSGGSKPAAVQSAETKDMVVAARPLPLGTMIKAEDIKLVKFPVQNFPNGAFTKPEEVIDRSVMSPILSEEPVLEGRLAVRGSGPGMTAQIPKGMRAVTISVTDVTGVSGFVLPKSRVDILVTGNPPRAGGETITRTVLQNMMVLSADQNMQIDGKTQAIAARMVTLLATPDQAETLTLAQNQGRIQLILRNGVDEEVAKTAGSNVSKLFRVAGPMPSAPSGSDEGGETPVPQPRPRRRSAAVAMTDTAVSIPITPPPPPPTPEVVVFRGQTKSVETVQPARAN